MRRILLEDADAAVHHLMDWQEHLHSADVAEQQFFAADIACDYREQAARSKSKADDLLLDRFRTPPYVYTTISSEARRAAQQRHMLRMTILHKAWSYADAAFPGEQGIQIMMGAELYAHRQRQQWGS